MHFLMPLFLTTIVIAFAIVSGRSIPSTDTTEKTSLGDQSNIIILEVPVHDDGAEKIDVNADRLLLGGRKFPSVQAMMNALEEDRMKNPSDPEATLESYTIVVPIARTFSSLKELFTILKEDEAGPKKTAETSQSNVKGAEADSSSHSFFLAR